jgi:hypothetical protein
VKSGREHKKIKHPQTKSIREKKNADPKRFSKALE